MALLANQHADEDLRGRCGCRGKGGRSAPDIRNKWAERGYAAITADRWRAFRDRLGRVATASRSAVIC
jgi:hypothetical protein